MNKKLFIFMFLILSMFVFFMVSCNGNTENVRDNEFVISKKTLSMNVYEMYRLTVNDNDAVWSTSDDTILSVDQTGMVTALKEGEAIVYAKLGDKKASCNIVITPSALFPKIFVEIDRENRIIIGDKYNLKFNYVTFNGHNYESEFTYLSSNPNVLTVSKTGELEAKNEGEAIITATTVFRGTEVKESFKYYVILAEELCIPQHNIDLYLLNYGEYNTNFEIGAKIIQNGERQDDAVFNYSIADDGIVSISDGIILANAIGSTEITVTSDYKGKIYRDTINVSVKKPVFYSDKTVSLVVRSEPYSFDATDIFNMVEGYNSSEVISIFNKTFGKEIKLDNGKLDLYSILPQSQNWIIYNEYYGVEVNVEIIHSMRLASASEYTSIGYSTEFVNDSNAWSYSVSINAWIGQVKFVGDTFEGKGIVVLNIYVTKSLSHLVLSTTKKYTEGKIADLAGGTWNRIELPVDTYNGYVNNETILYITNGDNVSSAKFYFAEPEFYIPEFSTTNATQNVSSEVVYGEETSSISMYATGWQLKFVLTKKITDSSVKKVVFYVNTNMTNPVYGLYLRIGSRNIELRANTWTKVELDINVYNNLVDNQTELKIDDGNGVNHKTFYFSKLYFN